MEMVERYSTLNKSGKFVDMPIKRQSITQRNKDFDKIKFHVVRSRQPIRLYTTSIR